MAKLTEVFDYKIKLIKQGFNDCVQTGAAQILGYYGLKKTVAEIKKEIPVFVSKNGAPLGSSVGHMATYFIRLGFAVTIHTVDIEIFDRSWANLSGRKLIENLRARRKYIKHHKYSSDALDLIFAGYTDFLEAGGKIVFPIIDEKYLLKLLAKGPIYAVVSFNFLNQVAKYKLEKSWGKVVPNPISGEPATHVVIVSGYDKGRFKIVDSDPVFGGKKKITSAQLIGSIYLAETDFDPILITLKNN